jgi:hypothetical protein
MKPETELTETNGNAPILSRNSESSNGPGRLMIRTGLHHFVLSKAVQHPFLITSSGNDGGAGSKLLTPSEPEIHLGDLHDTYTTETNPAHKGIFDTSARNTSLVVVARKGASGIIPDSHTLNQFPHKQGVDPGAKIGIAKHLLGAEIAQTQQPPSSHLTEIQITSPLFFEQANPGKPAGEFIFSSPSPKNIDAGLRQPGNPSPVFGPVQATVTLPATECLITPCQRYLLGSRRSSHPPREMILPLALQLQGCTMKSLPQIWPETNLSPTSAEMPKSPAVFSFSQEYKRRCWT